MIHIYYGDGKGKTSHAIGICIRQIACDQKVAWIAFLKQESSEYQILKQSCDLFVDYPSNKFYFMMNKEEQQEIKQRQIQLWKQIKINTKNYDCIILDELLDAINLEMIELNDVLKYCLDNQDKEIIITGRNPDEKLIEISDYVSEMKCIKHPYQKQIKARKGIEY